jgi:two-component system sensor histidine kinase PilS (NtrC family)
LIFPQGNRSVIGWEKMAPEEDIMRRYSLGEKLWWLILGRLAAALCLFFAHALWVRENGQRAWTTMWPALLVVTGLTASYAVVRRFFPRSLTLQARSQFLIDILLATWLVWTTNVIHSPYIALYIVVIGASSLFLSPRDAIVISLGCAVAFTSSALLALNGIGRTPDFSLLDAGRAPTFQSIGLFDIAFLVVGLLSARLAERQSRSDVRLQAANQSLANLRALHERIVQSIRSGLVTTDFQGRIYSFNAAAEEITGYAEEDVRGQDASIFFGDITEIVAASLATERKDESPRFEADCLTAEGLRLRLGFSVSPLFAETGETTGTVITFQDLTHIRALEETSRRQDRLAAIGRMAASIAHEIRNPLAAMRGSIQMLRADMQGNSAETELMEIILRESDRLNRIISDFLSYARPRSIVQAKVDVGELLKQTFMLLRHSAEVNSEQVIEAEIPPVPLLINADSEQLQQVFWNLARNALQAMPAGGKLRAEVQNRAPNRLQVAFSDNGRGMSPEQVEHLFEPFSSTTGGTGLGLSIVYQIIRDHGGTINVRSRQEQGTTITIELPREPDEASSS